MVSLNISLALIMSLTTSQVVKSRPPHHISYTIRMLRYLQNGADMKPYVWRKLRMMPGTLHDILNWLKNDPELEEFVEANIR
jgi:hypothetical protein